MKGRRLRLCVRHNSTAVGGNIGATNQQAVLFARISPAIVETLVAEALVEVSTNEDDSAEWNVLDATSTVDQLSSVSFLPLEVTFPDGSRIYTSFNGGFISEEDAIELAAPLIPNEKWANQEVVVKPLCFIEDVDSVEVEPLTVEDWELMEVHADVLENGGILQQISIVQAGQILALDVSGPGNRDMVRVRIGSMADGAPCRRLMANTEICIKPKPRKRAGQVSYPLRLLPTRDDLSAEILMLADREDMELPSLLPGSVMINPKTLLEPGTQGTNQRHDEEALFAMVWRDTDGDIETDEISIVSVKTSTLVAESCAALHPLTRLHVQAVPLLDHVRMLMVEPSEVRRKISYTKMLLESEAVLLTLEPVTLSIDPETNANNQWTFPAMSVSKQLPIKKLFETEFQHLPEKFDIAPFSDGCILPPQLFSRRIVGKRPFRLRLCPAGHENDKVQVNRNNITSTAIPYMIDDLHAQVEECSSQLQQHCSQINMPPGENRLNLLPAIPDVTEQLSEEKTRDMSARFNGMAIQGDIGSGKTHHALILAARLRLTCSMSTFYVDCKRLQSTPDMRMSNILDSLTGLFREATQQHGAAIILDDIDELVPDLFGEDGGQSTNSAQQTQTNPMMIDQVKLLSDHLRWLIEAFLSSAGSTFLVFTCRHRSSVLQSALGTKMLYDVMDVPSFGPRGRAKLFGIMLRSGDGAEFKIADPTLTWVGKMSEGYRPHDLRIFALRLRQNLLTSKPEDFDQYVEEWLQESFKKMVPLARQGVQSEDTTNVDVGWDDVGGLFEAKKELTAIVLHPVRYRRIYANAPIRLPRGVLLFGPPGCGKSLLVPALARECGYSLVMCRGAEVLDKYIGASEAKVRRLFDRAQTAAPSILFLDELDALAPRRGTDPTGVTDRVVNQLLTYLDGVERTDDRMFIVAATSRPDKIDPALLRPGRLERHVYIGFPETDEEMNNVLRKMMKDRSMEPSLRESIESGSLWGELDHRPSFSPADIRGVWNAAYLDAIHECLATENQVDPIISVKNMKHAIQTARPSLGQNDRNMYEAACRPFTNKKERKKKGKGGQQDRWLTPQDMKTALRY